MLLAVQMVLLPVYLHVFLGDVAAALVQWEPFLHAIIWLIVVPLSLAAVCQAWAARSAVGKQAMGTPCLPRPG